MGNEKQEQKGGAKFTPGPWKLTDGGPGEVYVCGADDRIVCDFAEPYYGETGPDETAVANAALIVAAPKLHASVVALLSLMTEDGIAAHTTGDVARVVTAAHAALTEAEGK